MQNLYESVIKEKEKIIESKSEEIASLIKEGETLDEGIITSIIGGLAGVTAGASIMKAVCKALGIEKGLLYDLLTSKMICGIAGAKIGNNLTK